MSRVFVLILIPLLLGCNYKKSETIEESSAVVKELIPDLFFGLDLNEFSVETKKIERGDTFGKIIEENK